MAKPSIPVDLQNSPDNFLQFIYDMDSRIVELETAESPQIEEITGGRVSIFDLGLSPAEGVLVADPQSTEYTGMFIAGDGIEFDGDLYVMGNVVNGVLKTGFTDVGTLFATDAVIEGTIIIGSGSEAGGWFINSTSIFNQGISLDSSIPAILIGDATAVMTGLGVFIGDDLGTYKMRIGDPAGNYLLWDGANLSASGQWIKSAGMNPALQEWQSNIVFSSASDVQVNWTSGTIRLSDGTTYSISAGNTGTMVALTYIYLDIAISSTVLQITTTYSTAVGDGKVLIAAAQNATSGASVIAYSGQQPIINGGAQITALSILAGNIAAGAITASKISVTSLSAITASMGALTIDGILTMNGPGGAITIGTTPPGGPASGTGLWIDRTGVYSLISGVQQTTLTSDGLTAGAGAALLGRDGLELRNNALTDEEASVFMNELGWVFNQTAEANGSTRKLRMGMRDVGSGEPEGVIQYNIPGSEVTIPNYDFATLDMTNWSIQENGLELSPLGTLSTSFQVNCLTVGPDGSVYVGLQNGTTSSVWRYNAGVWAAYGTLSTGFQVTSLVFSGNDLYAGVLSGTTSAVWRSVAGGAWAAYGTLNPAFGVSSLVFIGSDLYAGMQSGATTSTVWRSVAGGAWAAYGTLGTAFSVRSLLVIGADIYAAGAFFTTSTVWRSVAGGAWAAYGTLGTSFIVHKLMALGADIYATGANFTSSSVWRSVAGGAWAAFGTLSTLFQVYSMVSIGSDIYVGIIVNATTSAVWRSVAGGAFAAYGYLPTTYLTYGLVAYNGDLYSAGYSYGTSACWRWDINLWDASSGVATAYNNSDMVPEFWSATRFAVTAGNQILLTASNFGEISGGTLVITVGFKFYTAVSGGSLVSTVTAFTRTLTANGGMLKMEGLPNIVPPTATHAVIFAKFSQTVGVTSTAGFDRFIVEATSGVRELIFNDDGVQIKDSGYAYGIALNKIATPGLITIGTAETTVFDKPVPAGWLTGSNMIQWFVDLIVVMTTSRSVTWRLYYDDTVVATWTKGGAANITAIYREKGTLFSTGSNAQRGIVQEDFMNVTTPGSATSIYTGTGAEADSVEKNIKLTGQLSGAVTSAVIYGIVLNFLSGRT